MNKIAKGLSHLLNPAGVALVVFGGLGWREGVGWGVGLWAMVLFGLGPALILSWLYWRGSITQLYLPERRQRGKILLCGVAYYALCTAVMVAIGAPAVMLAAGLAVSLMVAAVWLINCFWKISIHATGVGGTVFIALSVGGFQLWPILIALPLIVWARLYLKVHTVGQVLAGLVLGGGTTWLVFGWG